MADEPRLQIDDDWKSQAQREKERIAEQVEQREPAQERGAGMGAADFRGLINMLAMQAMIGLGGLRDPSGANIPPSPELAKFHIDLLDVLDKKTRGNLSDDEKKMLDTTLYQLRMAYVQIMTPMPEGPAASPRSGASRT